MFKLPTLFVCALCVLFLNTVIVGQGQPPVCASITPTSLNYSQDFNTLSNAPSGSLATSVPVGFGFVETGSRADSSYQTGNGSSSAAQTFSFGTEGNTDRAFGGIRASTLITTIGGCFVNNSGSNITSLQIAYDGEQWRLAEEGRADRLDFQYSLDATSLVTGTWTDVDSLDFHTPNTVGFGAKNGNLTSNRTSGINATIPELSVPDGATIFIRFLDYDVTVGAAVDDGLAIDNFSLTATVAPTSATVSLSGRVLTAEGRGVPFALVSISGDSMRTVRTNPFGYYRFTDLAVGQTYIVSVSSKSLAMTNSSRMIKLQDEVSGFNFIADPR